MGIFDINMPMLYGEGSKAFIKLQEEIIKSAEDHTIFAWEDPQASDYELCGLLAPHPRCFRNTGNFQPISAPNSEGDLIAVTNRGISLSVLQYITATEETTAMLNCTEFDSVNSFAYIHILYLDERPARIRSHRLGKAPRRGFPKSLVVKQNPRIQNAPKILRGQQWFTVDSIKLPVRYVNGGDKLAFFKVAFFKVTEHSAIRSVRGGEAPPITTTQGRPAQMCSSPSDFLFQIPHKPRQVALILHISAQDSTGFPFWHHAEIDIGIDTGVTFLVAASDLGEGDEQYEDEEHSATTPRQLTNAKPLPASVKFKMEESLVVTADLSWEEVGGETVACISLEAKDDPGP